MFVRSSSFAQAATKREILRALGTYESALLQFAEDLVRIATENPPGRHYERCVTRIKDELGRLGLPVRIIDVPTPDGADRRQCLLGVCGSGNRLLWFHGHYDVVPASGADQFEPSREPGRLTGRGSADMKGGLAAMIYATRVVMDLGPPLSTRIGLALVPDEETGGTLGTGYLADQGLIPADAVGMLTPEPTSGIVWNGSRGALSMEVRVKGRPAHVGQMYDGVNAFERMVDVVHRLSALKAVVESRLTGFHIQPDAARRSILLLGGTSGGGTNFNTVPAQCSFSIDRRINPEERLETERAALFEIFEAARADGIELDVRVFQEAHPSSSSESTPVARALAESIETVTGRPPVFEWCPGLLETRFYAQRGTPAFAYGPGMLNVAHGPEEFVETDKVIECAAVYALTAIALGQDAADRAPL